MKRLRFILLALLALGIVLVLPGPPILAGEITSVAAAAPDADQTNSSIGAAAAVLCGLFGRILFCSAGVIAGMLATCLLALFDALYD